MSIHNLQDLPTNITHVTQKRFIEFLCHFIASCIDIIKNTPKCACKTKNSNTKPREVEIHSQEHKTLMCGTRVHVGLEFKSIRTKKNQTTKNRFQSQGHKILMYGT